MRIIIATTAALLISSAALANGALDNSDNYGSILLDRDKPVYDTAPQRDFGPIPYPVLDNSSTYGTVLNDLNRPSRFFALGSQPAVGDVTGMSGPVKDRDPHGRAIFESEDTYGTILNDL